MLGSVLALAQVLSKRGAFWCVRGGLLSYIGLALDRTMVQSSNLVYLESDVGPLNEFSYVSVCLSICLSGHGKKVVPL